MVTTFDTDICDGRGDHGSRRGESARGGEEGNEVIRVVEERI